MKKLRINKKYLELLENEGKGEMFAGDSEIGYLEWIGLDCNKFRKLLHNIVDEYEQIYEKEVLHNEIHKNNFTSLIMLGIIEVVE